MLIVHLLGNSDIPNTYVSNYVGKGQLISEYFFSCFQIPTPKNQKKSLQISARKEESNVQKLN